MSQQKPISSSSGVEFEAEAEAEQTEEAGGPPIFYRDTLSEGLGVSKAFGSKSKAPNRKELFRMEVNSSFVENDGRDCSIYFDKHNKSSSVALWTAHGIAPGHGASSGTTNGHGASSGTTNTATTAAFATTTAKPFTEAHRPRPRPEDAEYIQYLEALIAEKNAKIAQLES